MMDKDYYYFYFLDEKKFIEEYDIINKDEKNKIKLISTIGQIKNYDVNTKLGEIIYESKLLYTNFQRVSHYIQLDQSGLFFFYGFLNFVNDKLQFVCEYISEKPIEKFDRLEYQKYITFKRNIIEKCKKIKENKESNI
jgi:hypothetical protein